MGRSDKRDVESRLDTIYEHFLKLQYSPAAESRNGWKNTVSRERRVIARLLKDSPNLRSTMDAWVASDRREVAQVTARELSDYGEEDAAALVVLAESANKDVAKRVLEFEFFPHPPEPTTSE